MGLKEIPKPTSLLKNGGFWVKIADIQLHIGTENIEGKSKRHPAFEVEEINKIKEYLIEKGIRVKEDDKIPGINRFSFFDYWNNRIEFLAKE
ncbi:MAG: hypothetical protein R2798_09870 [Chitinophagales bacterium]